MNANIRRGKLVAPKSLGAGLARRKLVEREVSRIEAQLSDPKRSGTMPLLEYDAWQTSAVRVLRLFQLEQRLLDEWIDVRRADSERLLRDAFEVLKVLEEQVDLDPHELAVVDRLARFFDAQNKPQQHNQKETR